MQIQLDTGEHLIHINKYENNTLVINNTEYRTPVVVTGNKIYSDWLPHSLKEITEQTMQRIISLEPEIILLGCESVQINAPLAMQKYFAHHQRVIDVMSTAAACRTFTILASEKRNLAALLYP